MKREKENDDYMLEVQRMISEGLGGGIIEHEYQRKQLEVYENQSRETEDDEKCEK